MVTTRPARPTDLAAIARIARNAFAPYVERIGRPPAPMLADHATPVAAGHVWVTTSADDVVGYIVLIDAGDHLEVDAIAVDPTRQGLGVGRVLLQLADDEARRRGFGRVELYTNEAMTENLGYYVRRGFVETRRGVQDGFRRVFFVKVLVTDDTAVTS